ncbi:MAG: GxxExxY protein [Candidatus Latescibacteria bacterium]|nr:GxxExxY protein [Candidatus Latescibacterota bacterium]
MGAAFEVHKTLGPGYTENIYEEAFVQELESRKLRFSRQKNIKVLYKGKQIGEYKLDMIVEDKIILELKAVSAMNELFESQLISYLKATGMKLGIIINFGTKKVTYKRIAR